MKPLSHTPATIVHKYDETTFVDYLFQHHSKPRTKALGHILHDLYHLTGDKRLIPEMQSISAVVHDGAHHD